MPEDLEAQSQQKCNLFSSSLFKNNRCIVNNQTYEQCCQYSKQGCFFSSLYRFISLLSFVSVKGAIEKKSTHNTNLSRQWLEMLIFGVPSDFRCLTSANVDPIQSWFWPKQLSSGKHLTFGNALNGLQRLPSIIFGCNHTEWLICGRVYV